jgi:addiction module HigA family antidote
MRASMAIHPGEVLKEDFMVPHGLNTDQLAIALGVTPNDIIGIIQGTQNITSVMAILLGRTFNTSTGFWLELQVQYELDIKRSKTT